MTPDERDELDELLDSMRPKKDPPRTRGDWFTLVILALAIGWYIASFDPSDPGPEPDVVQDG